MRTKLLLIFILLAFLISVNFARATLINASQSENATTVQENGASGGVLI